MQINESEMLNNKQIKYYNRRFKYRHCMSIFKDCVCILGVLVGII